MLLILYAIALALAAGGAWALAWGIPMIVLERGWTWVISGSVYLTGAAIVFALAMVVRALRQLPDMLEAGYPEEASHAASRSATGGKAGAAKIASVEQTPLAAAPAEARRSAEPLKSAIPPTPVLPAKPAPELPAVLVAPVLPVAGDMSTAAVVAPVVAPAAPSAKLQADPLRPGVAQTYGGLTNTPRNAPGGAGNLTAGRKEQAPAATQPAIPAAVEGRLNDLLRPGVLATAAKAIGAGGAGQHESGPRPADQNPARGAPSPLPSGSAVAASTGSAPAGAWQGPGAGSLAESLADSLASSLSKSLSSSLGRSLPQSPADAATQPDETAPGAATGRNLSGPDVDVAKTDSAQVSSGQADPMSSPSLRQLSSLGAGASNLAPGDHKDQSAAQPLVAPPAAATRPDISLRDLAPQGLAPREPVSRDVAASQGMASRIGSLFGRKAAQGDSAKARADDNRPGSTAQSAARGSAPGTAGATIFPVRPAPRPAAPSASAMPTAGAFPAKTAPAVSTASTPVTTRAPAPAKTSVGDVVFPERPAPRPGQPLPVSEPLAPLAVAPSDAAAVSGPPTVVGSYTAAGTHYVMFSDGAIEAQTPDGVLHFPSLDALKAHMGGGGQA